MSAGGDRRLVLAVRADAKARVPETARKAPLDRLPRLRIILRRYIIRSSLHAGLPAAVRAFAPWWAAVAAVGSP